jgi:hypothetical protein
MQGTKSNMARDSRLDEMTVDDAGLALCVGVTTIVEDVLEALDTLRVVVALVVAAMKALGVQYTEIILDALSESEVSLLGQRPGQLQKHSCDTRTYSRYSQHMGSCSQGQHSTRHSPEDH